MDFEQLIARVKAMTSSMTAAQLMMLALSFVLVVGVVVGSAWWVNRPSYVLLFSDMDADSAGEMVSRLKTMKVEYQLDEGGRGIRVPASRVDELRLELSAQGLPASGRVGFEIFDRTAFGATEFMEQINYRRALEGEIARTIATLSEVTSARVHIAMGKDALFGESRPAKASVVLKLRGQRGLSVGAISGISNLVASSVEGLGPDAVVILDSFGRPLLRPGGDTKDAGGALQVERQQRVEGEMATRVIALLEPVVGIARVRVNVAVRLDPKSSEETEERWDPNAVVRSKQTSADVANGPAGGAGAVAGARGNVPPAAPDGKTPLPPVPALVAVSGTTTTRNAETTNYEVSRMTRHTIQPAGDVTRLSVAVIIDDNHVSSRGKTGLIEVTRTPRKPEDLQKLHGLVAAAVGFDADRGDLLTIENVSFDEVPTEDEEPPSALQTYGPQIWEGSRIVAIAAVGIIALLFVIRPMVQRSALQTRLVATVASAALPSGAQALRTVTDMENQIEAQLDADGDSKGRKLPVLTRRATALGQKDPENVAKVLRGWLGETGR